jgi:hypothetical protein
MSPPATPVREPDRLLAQARVLWLALLIGPLSLFGLAVFLIASGILPPSDDEQVKTMLAWLSGATLLILMPMAYLLRRHIFGHVRAENPQAPLPRSVFLRGQIAFGALCEAAAIVGLVAAVGRGTLMPTGLLALVAIGVQAVNFPKRQA